MNGSSLKSVMSSQTSTCVLKKQKASFKFMKKVNRTGEREKNDDLSSLLHLPSRQLSS